MHGVLSSCAFVLVCEQEENRILAETILAFIVQYSHTHLMNMEQKMAEVKMCPLHMHSHAYLVPIVTAKRGVVIYSITGGIK